MMRLDVHVGANKVAQLYRERDEYVLHYLPGTSVTDFVSLALPVREAPWRWPRDLFPVFRQNLPEGYLLGVIREEFGPLLDGTDLSLLAVIGGAGIGRVTVTPEGVAPGHLPRDSHLGQPGIGHDQCVTKPIFADRVRRLVETADAHHVYRRNEERAAL
jgi:serine/threonine-protein kinase HipA